MTSRLAKEVRSLLVPNLFFDNPPPLSPHPGAGTIAETESAYGKILESSQTLLTVLKRETNGK